MSKFIEGVFQLVFAVLLVLVVKAITLGALRWSINGTRKFVENRRQKNVVVES